MNGQRRLQLLLLLLCTVMLAATMLRPTLALERNTYRYVFVFDISQSMNVVDVPPPAPSMSRLAFAKQSVQAAMAEMPCGAEVGLALFTGHRAFLMITPVEVCASYRELSTMLASIDWQMTWEARSEVAKGVFSSIKLLGALPSPTRLVFLTDGHEAPPINPDAPPQFVGDPGKIRGLVVGVGGDTAVAIPKFDQHGEPDGFWQATDVMQTDTFRAAQLARDNPSAAVTGTEHLSALRGARSRTTGGPDRAWLPSAE